MKLLIITQKIDKEDDVLGFFHRWLEKLASRFEKITAICLWEGKHELPSNVKILSLGKEKIRSRLRYVVNFYKYIWRERKDYDTVLVHMNSEYVVLGGFFWKLWRKKILLWNNHIHGNFATWLAVKIADKSFYTSPFSFNARISGKKGRQMPAGIDTDVFRRDVSIERTRNSLLFLGRISPVKRVEKLVEAVELLDREGINFILNIVGEAGEKDAEYFKKIKKMAGRLEDKGKIKFRGKVPNYLAPKIYNQNEIFVNLTNPGSLDKTILEAIACETLIMVSNNSFKGILPEEFIFEENNAENLKDKIANLFKKGTKEKEDSGKRLREYVVKNHSLDVLIEKILEN